MLRKTGRMEGWNTGMMGFWPRAFGACGSDRKFLYWVNNSYRPEKNSLKTDYIHLKPIFLHSTIPLFQIETKPICLI
jgi:hypothetical protein